MPLELKLVENSFINMKYLKILCIAFLSLSSVQAQTGKSPNIIYILADDMGSGDVKAYNNDCKFPTPHLDQMAEGVKFTDSHTSSSVCTPTRYGIVTGRYSWRTFEKGVTHGLQTI